jgi:hypothetical protein
LPPKVPPGTFDHCFVSGSKYQHSIATMVRRAPLPRTVPARRLRFLPDPHGLICCIWLESAFCRERLAPARHGPNFQIGIHVHQCPEHLFTVAPPTNMHLKGQGREGLFMTCTNAARPPSAAFAALDLGGLARFPSIARHWHLRTRCETGKFRLTGPSYVPNRE